MDRDKNRETKLIISFLQTILFEKFECEIGLFPMNVSLF